MNILAILAPFWQKIQPARSYKILYAYLKLQFLHPVRLFNPVLEFDSVE